MASNPNWPRWILTSAAKSCRALAQSLPLKLHIEGIDMRDADLMNQDRAEFRMNGPWVRERSHNFYELQVGINILITFTMTGNKNMFAPDMWAGEFQSLLSEQIKVVRYGNGPEDDNLLLGCLVPRSNKGDSVKVWHFGQIGRTEEIRQIAVDAMFYMDLLVGA